MRKLLGAIALSLWTMVTSNAETMSVADQTALITAYGIATGQLPAPPKSEEELGLPPDKCGTAIVNSFFQSRDQIDRHLMASLGVRLEGRPDSTLLTRSYGSPLGLFLIHYIDTGSNAPYQANVRTLVDSVPDYIVMVARIADSMYMHQVDTLGYPKPPVDGFYPTGLDDRFDIYVMGLAKEFYGLTYIDAQVTAQTATAYMIIDNDYADNEKYVNRPLDAARVTIAHEYFHAIQFGMDVLEYDGPSSGLHRQYWMEMSAVWMEEECYDHINDYYLYLPYFLGNPTISLQAFGGKYNLHPYGAGIFAIYLTERFDRDVIKDIWSRCASVAGPNFLTACEAVVRERDTALHKLNLASALTEFSIWNFFTGQYGSSAPTVLDTSWERTPVLLGYEEREAYPIISTDSMLVVNSYPFSFDVDTGGFRPQYNGSSFLLFANLDKREDCIGCARFDTAAAPDTMAKYSCDSVLSPSDEARFPGRYVTIGCDSLLQMYLAVQHPTLVEWGIAVLYQLAAVPDSFEVARFDIPLLGGGPTVFMRLDALNPGRYRSITVTVSPTTNFYVDYANRTAPAFGLVNTNDTSRFLARNNAVLTPYPNPAVVSQLNGRPLTFRFQVANDETNTNLTANPLLLIDLYTVAGEFVRTINATFGGDDRLGVHAEGIYETAWDMKNTVGKDVASGVYLAYARLWDSPNKRRLLAENKVKVALIR